MVLVLFAELMKFIFFVVDPHRVNGIFGEVKTTLKKN